MDQYIEASCGKHNKQNHKLNTWNITVAELARRARELEFNVEIN
jgi:hypothetical protein